MKLVIGTLLLLGAFAYIAWFHQKFGKRRMVSDFDYCYGNRFTIHKKGNRYLIYDREFQNNIKIYDKRISFDSRKEAENFMLEYGELFLSLENN